MTDAAVAWLDQHELMLRSLVLEQSRKHSLVIAWLLMLLALVQLVCWESQMQ